MNLNNRSRRRFFCEEIPTNDGEVALSPSEGHHLFDVLRIKIGDDINILDGNGNIARIRVVDYERNRSGYTIKSEILILWMDVF